MQEIYLLKPCVFDSLAANDCSIEDLRQMGFPAVVTDALQLLTHDPAVPYMEYVASIKPNPVARAVKLVDLAHNSDLSRMAPSEIDEWALARQKKYQAAIDFLKS